MSQAPAKDQAAEAHVTPLGEPVGFPVEDWQGCLPPPRTAMEGRHCRVEPLDPERHAAELHRANLEDREQRIWTYLA